MSDKDVLVVVSKLKSYIKSEYGMSTSSQVPAVLTGEIKKLLANAAEKAAKDRRKTIMDRDFAAPDSDKEALVVVSKLKTFIKGEHGMSTSSQVPGVLTTNIKSMLSAAAECAQKDRRKTIMDRDFCSSEPAACTTGSCSI